VAAGGSHLAQRDVDCALREAPGRTARLLLITESRVTVAGLLEEAPYRTPDGCTDSAHLSSWSLNDPCPFDLISVPPSEVDSAQKAQDADEDWAGDRESMSGRLASS
jgi:hypothetical protein